jgi:hypothetical protein
MKTQFIAASAVLVLSSGVAFANSLSPVGTTSSINAALDHIAPQTVVSQQVLTNGPISPVPLPAAGWMLLAGLGGLVALRRRAKA